MEQEPDSHETLDCEDVATTELDFPDSENGALASQNEEEEEEGEEAESGDGSEYAEEDQEPKLVYERIKNDISKIINMDAISCVAVHHKLMAVGTHSGRIHIMDHEGNKVHDDLVIHNSTVNQLSIDSKGEFVASCSSDRACVIGLLTVKFNHRFGSGIPVYSVAIDPNFTRGSDRRFVTGDNSLILHYRNILNIYKQEMIRPNDGPFRNIKWRGSLIAWANDSSVGIWDVTQKACIVVVKADHDTVRFRPEVSRCCLFWKSDEILLLGWGDTVKVCEVKRKPQPIPQPPDKYVEIIFMQNISLCISGVSCLNDEIVLLVMDRDSLDSPGSMPQVMVIKMLPSSRTEELSSDFVTPRGYQSYTCRDYHLDSIPNEIYFIACPKDIIYAKPREDDDHVAWLVERSRFEEALSAIEKSTKLRRFTYSQVGKNYMDFLIERGLEEDIAKAAALAPRICGTDKQLWDQVVRTFDAIDRLRLLSPYLPVPKIKPTGEFESTDSTGKDFILDHTVYEAVLRSLMKNDSAAFVKLIQKWPCFVYNSSVVAHDAMTILQFDSSNENLFKGLAVIYTNEGKQDKALQIYLQIGDHKQVFELISKYDLYSTLKDKLSLLMQLNPEEASRLLIDNSDKISVDHVVKKLKSKPELLWVYLDQVVKRDPESNPEYHQLLVELYANHCPAKLLNFLKMSRHYSLEQAFAICKSKDLVDQMVYLLARMGNTKQALHYIMQNLKNIDSAIEFCKEQDDIELWNDLISLSMSDPQAIHSLLSNIGTNIPDPIGLIQQIPDNLKIPGLKDALVKILEDYRLQISLEERCQRVLAHDNFTLFTKLLQQRRKPILVDRTSACSACNRLLMDDSDDSASEIILFNCSHMFHEECLAGAVGAKESCSLCTATRSGVNFF